MKRKIAAIFAADIAGCDACAEPAASAEIRFVDADPIEVEAGVAAVAAGTEPTVSAPPRETVAASATNLRSVTRCT